ncbi:hypothetical protein EON81_24185 [bacterium]|nr:MAG: hypothetical protein EON81_24185 [bacterium]
MNTAANVRLTVPIADNPLADVLQVAGHEVMTDEQVALVQLAQVKDRMGILEEWEKELKEKLLFHYQSTGDKPAIPGGPTLEVRSRTTWMYDEIELSKAMPEVFPKIVKVDHAKVTAGIKARFLDEKDIEPFRISDTKEFVQVGKPKK